jgi:LysM repeat protein
MYRLRALSIIFLTLILAACMPVAAPLIVVIPPTPVESSSPTEENTDILPTITPTVSPPQPITPSPTAPQERTDVIHYVVQNGDSLSSIAEHFSLSLESVLFSNSSISPDNLEPGTTLVIPPMDGFYYTWEDGETLPKIAHRFDVSIHSIVDWHGNGLDGQIDDIDPGTSLFIPGGKISYLKWTLANQSTTPIPP